MVVVRDCIVVGLLFLCGCSTARHNIFEFVIEALCCCVVGRRVEGLFMVCTVSVCNVCSSQLSLLSPLLLSFFAGRSIC